MGNLEGLAVGDFNLDDFRYDERKHKCQESAKRDRDLYLFRCVWEGLDEGKRGRLKACLFVADRVQEELEQVTGGLVALQNPFLNTQLAHDIGDEVNDPLYAEVGRHRRAWISGVEYLCAIACWEAGEEYVPADPPWKHERWPARGKDDNA